MSPPRPPHPPPDRAMLVRLMTAMAAGDHAALFPFIEDFGGRLSGAVRSTLRSINRHDLAADREAVDFHIQTAALVIFDRASGWQPDGALPWTWANRAIRAAIIADVGHHTVELKDSTVESMDERGVAVRVADVDLQAMSIEQPEIALLIRAVHEVASERDARVHLEYQMQKGLGDRQPANTVARMLELTPANVRKIDQRVRGRLSALAKADPAFAALARISWVEAC